MSWWRILYQVGTTVIPYWRSGKAAPCKSSWTLQAISECSDLDASKRIFWGDSCAGWQRQARTASQLPSAPNRFPAGGGSRRLVWGPGVSCQSTHLLRTHAQWPTCNAPQFQLSAKHLPSITAVRWHTLPTTPNKFSSRKNLPGSSIQTLHKLVIG
jgi:hypothetical protein